MMGNLLLFGDRGLSGAGVELAIDLARIGAEDITIEALG